MGWLTGARGPASVVVLAPFDGRSAWKRPQSILEYASSWKAKLGTEDRGVDHHARFSTHRVIGTSMTRVTLAHQFGWGSW